MEQSKIIKKYKSEHPGSFLYESTFIVEDSQKFPKIYQKMMVFEQQCIPFFYDLKFGIREYQLYLEAEDEKIQFFLPQKDQKQWQEVLSKFLNQRLFHQFYRPIKKIGMGSFASVYLVEHTQTKIKYAVKSFSKETAYSQENGKQCLIKQIEIMRKTSHPNILKLQSVFESENSLYIVFQLLQEGQLEELLQNKKFTGAQVKKIMKNLLEGVSSLHSKGIMHRDLKPQNILMRSIQQNECVIADFGLAEYENQQQYLFTRCGTPGYVAPQVLNIKNMSQKYSTVCDIFSLGVIFHKLLYGQSIFKQKSTNSIVKANRLCQFNFDDEQYSTISADTLCLLKDMLCVDPKSRITAQQALNHPYFMRETSQIVSKCEQKNEQIPKQKQNRKLPVLNFTPKREKNKILKDSCLELKIKKQNVLLGKIDTIKDKRKDEVSFINNLDNPAKVIKISKFQKPKI